MLLIVALAIAAYPADTVRLQASDALDRARRQAPRVAAAASRAESARHGVSAARAWRNPTLSAVAENLGVQRQTTGRDGVAGVEGQLVLSTWLPLGGEHGAAIRVARAQADAAAAGVVLAEHDAAFAVVESIALVERDRAAFEASRAESAALGRFATAMARRAQEGRTAGGDAARARLEAASASARGARIEAALVGSEATLARLLGLPVGTVLEVTATGCRHDAMAERPHAQDEAAAALAAQARAEVDRQRGLGVPDLVPQVGLRRTAGFSGLIVGVAVDLPVLSRGRAATAAARAEAEAREAEHRAVANRLAAERYHAEQSVALLEASRAHFGTEWQRDLVRVVTAAEARYDAGEATLAELLDARRARLAALDDYQRWRAERRIARAALARARGVPVEAWVLCDDPSE
ncbi:MAG: TolC family protein [Gemmatimonadales bacterium]